VHPRFIAGAVLALVACGGTERPATRLPDAPRAALLASVLRVPVGGGQARLYRVPGLTESAWKQADKLPPVKRLVGTDLEQGAVYALDAKNNLIGLDLDSRRTRSVLSQVRDATVGPDGALYAVDSGAVVTQIVRRTPVRFRTKLVGATRGLFGTMNGALVTVPAADRAEAMSLTSDQAQGRAALPGGAAAATYLGDLVAVAADSAVILYEPQAKQPVRVLPVSGGARAVAFSPSGHRLYVARGKGDIQAFDRFSSDALESIQLPGPARELRGDLYGDWLLARPEKGDSVWVVDAASSRLAGAVATKWGPDLPAVAGGRTLLVRNGADVRAFDLGASGLPATGAVAGGAADLWLPLAWLPAEEQRRELAAAGEPDSGAAPADTAARPAIYLQVSSSQNPAWADELAGKLKAAGLPASVLQPKSGEEAYRVVLGPYATREQAEATGKSLGMPSFVITPQDQPPQ
jgi:hypothetical protein